MITKQIFPLTYIFSEIKISLLTVTLIGVVVDIFPIFFPGFLPDIPISIATTLGIAISILISFKVNQSYDRWWEARKVWGEIVNDSRTLVLQLKMYMDPSDPIIKTIAYRQIAWCYSLGQSLRKTDPLKNLGGLVSELELKQLQSQKKCSLGYSQFSNRFH